MNKHVTPSFKTPSSFITFRLARLQSSLNAQGAALLKEKAGISLVEWRIIQVLRMFHDASLTDIARHVMMDKGQLSRKMKSMAEKGLLKTRRDEADQRVQHLQLTEKAQSLSDDVMPTMERRQEMLLADISPDDLATFYSVVEKVERASKMREVE